MGMAASQARFLQLTARRSNNEYMGQQINQARTALANKSAGLFERMLSLKPPTPPSSLDDKYYVQGYTFVDRADDLRKKVTWQNWDEVSEDEFPVTGSVTYSYFDAGNVEVTTTSPVSVSGEEYLEASGLTDTALTTALEADLVATAGMSEYEIDEYMQNPAQSALNNLVGGLPEGFVLPSDAESAIIRYVTLDHNSYDPNGDYQVNKETMPALLFFDNRERLIAFNELTFDDTISTAGFDNDYYVPGDLVNPAQNYDGGNPPAPVGVAGAAPLDLDNSFLFTVSPSVIGSRVEKGDELSYTGQFDEAQFNDDMNRYEFDKSAYDYQVERINLETAQLQQQDKSLELKLKQIDTDHNAIQTEMEAVQKVIKKNIETTFKTFA